MVYLFLLHDGYTDRYSEASLMFHSQFLHVIRMFP